jgi:hypothetical protein
MNSKRQNTSKTSKLTGSGSEETQVLIQLSDESLEIVQRSEKWSDIEVDVDPQRLWKAVNATTMF